MRITPATTFVAIQQVKGEQPTRFMKLARAYSFAEILNLPVTDEAYLWLDATWLLSHGFSPGMVRNHCGTSEVISVEVTDDGVVLIQTKRSVYQAIPDFG